MPDFPVVFRFGLRPVFVLFDYRVFRKKAEERRVVRSRRRSRRVRSRAERARRRTRVSVTASRADTKACLGLAICIEIVRETGCRTTAHFGRHST